MTNETASPRHRLEDPQETETLPEESLPAHDQSGHVLDYAGQPIHIDVDPIIPTGICQHCP